MLGGILRRVLKHPAQSAAPEAGMMGGMMMHKKVEQRLDMLERLMQQTIGREAAEASPERR